MSSCRKTNGIYVNGVEPIYCDDRSAEESKVLVIYTGGTIGMIRNKDNVLEPAPNTLVNTIRKYPNMHDKEYAQERFGNCEAAPLVLPFVQQERRRIVYNITEYDPILDSSNMTSVEWIRIAKDIKENYKKYDGFLILHGTDTLSYTASALSFILENLGKTVVITGSQIPIFETRTDGKDNFTASLIIAGNYIIPEVVVVFGSKCMRGNRVIKINTDALEAFASPNFPNIAKIGINFEVDYRLVYRSSTVSEFRVHTVMNENVGLLTIFPNIATATVRAYLQPPMRGVVLHTYGAGNMPSNRKDLLQLLKEATNRGVIIVNCSQCIEGTVCTLYETGQVLHDCGVISGYDMTPGAALSKLAYVLEKDEWNLETKKEMMERNLRGELTRGECEDIEDHDLVQAVARSLRISSKQEMAKLGASLFPAILNVAVTENDINKIDTLKGYGVDLSVADYDNRTALHVACARSSFETVEYLLANGVSVHERDIHGRNPLQDAIERDFHEIIKLLMKCGAHISESPLKVGEKLCSAAARDRITRLQSYFLAGASTDSTDSTGRTPLHVACLLGKVEAVKMLLNNGANRSKKDKNDQTCMDLAEKGGHNEIKKLLQNSS